MKAEKLENHLKECRTEKGVSQQDVADAVNISRESVLKYETGKSNPTLRTALRLSEYYNRTVNEIFTITEEVIQ